MIESFTAFARLPNPDFRETSLPTFLKDFQAVYNGSFGEGVRIVYEGPETPFIYRFDSKLLRDLLFNLCKNAAEANSAQTLITIKLAKDIKSLKIFIHNTGVPIPETLAQTLFDPYVSSKAGSNLGLGLAISRKIAFDHDGDLTLRESSEVAGVTFQLELPLSGAKK